jgi:delta 1-pyrroline-5-carboxylate dehydrogenase
VSVSTSSQTVDAEALVGGDWVKGTSRAEVRNPGNLADVVGTVPVLNPDDVDRSVRAANSAQAG